MAVLNTTSPLVTPSAPMEWPLKTVPSARARMAGVNEGSNDTTALLIFSAYPCAKREGLRLPACAFQTLILYRKPPFQANSRNYTRLDRALQHRLDLRHLLPQGRQLVRTSRPVGRCLGGHQLFDRERPAPGPLGVEHREQALQRVG